MQIRAYEPKDFTVLSSWWASHNEVGPLPSMLPPSTTYVLESEAGVPHYTVSLILTNISEYCYVENFCRNPTLPPNPEAVSHLLEYIGKVAKSQGYKRLFCLAHTEPTKRRYEALGFTKTLDGLAAFSLPLE